MKSILLVALAAAAHARHGVRHANLHTGSVTEGHQSSVASAHVYAAQATASSDCKTYVVKSGDTCTSIMKSTGATWAQLISWNSEINSQCSNLASLTDKTICVSNPMGDYGMPTNAASDGGTDMSGSATATAGASTITTTASVPSPTLDGTVSRCGKYYQIGANEDCGTVEKKFGISLSDFIYLNPEVFTNCTNLQKDVYYCAQPVGSISTYSGYGGTTSDQYSKLSMTSAPSPTYSYGTGGRPSIPIAEDTRKDCAEYAWYGDFKYKAQSRLLDCWSLAMVWDISPEDFILWNPSMAKNGTLGNSSANASSSATTSADSQPSSYNYPCTISQSTSYCVGISAATSRSVSTSSASTTAEAVSTTDA